MGWIKLDRQLLDNDLWNYEPFTRGQAWVDLLLMASHDDESFLNRKGVLVKLKRGQLTTSLKKLSTRWKWSVGKTERYLRMLTEMDMVIKSSNADGTVLSIVNYDKFQSQRYANRYADRHTDEHTDEYTDGPLTRSKRNKEEKKPLSYSEEMDRQMKMLEAWAAKEDDDEQS